METHPCTYNCMFPFITPERCHFYSICAKNWEIVRQDEIDENERLVWQEIDKNLMYGE